MKKYNSLKEFGVDFRSVSELPGWINNYPDIHRQVKLIRESLGISQQQLAGNIGLTWRSIPNIENGKVNPKISTLKKIAEYLNCELQILLIPKERLSANIPPVDVPEEITNISPQRPLFDDRPTLEKRDEPVDDYAIEKKKEYFWD